MILINLYPLYPPVPFLGKLYCLLCDNVYSIVVSRAVSPNIIGELGMAMLGVSKDKRSTATLLDEGEITSQNQSASARMQLIKSLTPTVAMPDVTSDMA